MPPEFAIPPAEAAGSADVVITMLANPQVLEEVVFDRGLARALRPRQVLMDMSTVGPGIYFYRLTTNQGALTRPFAIAK